MFYFCKKKSVESVLSLFVRLSARHCWLEATVFVGLFVTAICYFFKVSAIILRFYGFFLVITDTFFSLFTFFSSQSAMTSIRGMLTGFSSEIDTVFFLCEKL